MIENEQQYHTTTAEGEKFTQALAEATAQSSGNPLHRLGQAAIRSQLDDLEQELHEYESLRSGKKPVLSLDSFTEVPHKSGQ